MPKEEDPGPRILVAGVGNVLHGDDGFGVEVVNHLMKRTDLPASVKVIETGIGGMSLVQELMYGYDALGIIDAYKNNRVPGEVCLVEPVLPDLSEMDAHERRDYFADTHYATPFRALSLLEHMGNLPSTIRIIGCEPEEVDALRIGLSEPVAKAVPDAVDKVLDWIETYLKQYQLIQQQRVK